MSETTSVLLQATLETSIPFLVIEFADKTFDELQAIAHDSAQVVAEKGDIIQFRGKKQGETAAAYNALARGIAAASFCPGGIKFLGLHYDAKAMLARWGRTSHLFEQEAPEALTDAAAIFDDQPG